MAERPIIRRNRFKEKLTWVSTDPEPLGRLLESWKGVAARLRKIADQQGAAKAYDTAAENSMMAEVLEGCATELEKSLSLYTIEEVEGDPPDEPKRKPRKGVAAEETDLIQELAPPSDARDSETTGDATKQ